MKFFCHFFKQHFIFSALVLSLLVHTTVILWSDLNSNKHSSKGSSHTLILQKSPTASPALNPHILNSKKPIIKRQTQPEAMQHSPIKSPTNASLKFKENINKNIITGSKKNSTGVNLELSGKDRNAVSNYRKTVLLHILKNMGSAPYFGQANISIKISSIGIARGVEIELISGPIDYKNWLMNKILSSNPMPAFPSSISKKEMIMHFPLSHEL